MSTGAREDSLQRAVLPIPDSASVPWRPRETQSVFFIEAARYSVLPLDGLGHPISPEERFRLAMAR